MGEVVRTSDYEARVSLGDDEQRVLDWEVGLPSAEDLTPLSTSLIPPELASAFSITPEPHRSMNDVNRASQSTVSSLRKQSQVFSSSNLKSLPSFAEDRSRDPVVVEEDEHEPEVEPGSSNKDGSESRKLRRLDSSEEANSGMPAESLNDDQSARTLKRPRLVWTPQLHKRFVDVVAHLGIKHAVPKTIMQLMNVEGLTRENVASHLQKYRLYLKRMQGLSNEGPSSSDHLFASTPVPQSLQDQSGQGHMPLPLPSMMHMPVLGVPHGHGHGHMGIPVVNPAANPAAYHGFHPNHYNMYMEQQQRDLSGNKFGSFVSHSHVAPNNK